MITALIMAGGEGTRLWPLSRRDKPKQLLKFSDNQKTMLQETLERINILIPLNQIFIVTNEKYKIPIKNQVKDIPEENIIIEPVKRNTAASIGLSSVVIEKKFPGSTIIVLPSDHLIEDQKEFVDILRKSIMAASFGENLVTIGLRPTHPETGYGYIHFGDSLLSIDDDHVYKVKNFTEKPDLKTAENFLKEGEYLWNSGILVCRLNAVFSNIEKYLPVLYNSLIIIKSYLGTDSFEKIVREEFKKLESISISYGVLEKSDDVFVIPGSFGWYDLGSWNSLEKIKDADDDGNVTIGKHYGIDTNNSIIYSSNKVVITVGVNNLVIADTGDALLICDKNRAQEVKDIRKILEENGLEDYL